MDKRRNTNESSNHELHNEVQSEFDHDSRERYELDVDRMINEGLGGGYITEQNGLIDDNNIDETLY